MNLLQFISMSTKATLFKTSSPVMSQNQGTSIQSKIWLNKYIKLMKKDHVS